MKVKIFLLGLVFAGVITSCNDYLDVESTSTLEGSVVYSSYSLAESAIDGILNPIGLDKSYRNRFIPFYGKNTDCEWSPNSSSDDAKAQLCNYNTAATNTQMNVSSKNQYEYSYMGIERANLAIEGLREYGDVENNADMAYLLGRALTYRAFYYADLLKTYGDVPARFEPVTTETTSIAKTDRSVIYTQLLADLKEAEDYVDWPNASDYTTSTEDINKAFVKAFRARLAMNAGGSSAHPSSMTEATSDYTISSSLDHDEMLQIAYSECKDVIAYMGDLDSDYEGIFERNCGDDLTAGIETLWEIPFKSSRGQMLKYFAIPHKSADQYINTSGQGGSFGAVPTVYYDFDSKDLRRDVSVVPWSWDQADDDGNAAQVLSSLSKFYFGKYRYEWMTHDITNNDDGVDPIYMRLAEVYLIAAECANEIDGPSTAGEYLKAVRKRAFSSDDQQEKVEDYVNALTTQDAMFDAIVDEYEYEFTGEHIRKQCLIRWNLLADKLSEAKEKMTALQNHTGIYAALNEYVYYSTDEDGETLDYYGLDWGETEDKSNEYTDSKHWIDPDDPTLEADDIESLCYYEDVNARQFWPIWQVVVDASNGVIVNSYGY